VPEGAEIAQVPATLLALVGVSPALEAHPIAAVLDDSLAPEEAEVAVAGGPAPSEARVYTEEEEARMIERLRDLGYE
jgi:hypothetical protein